MSKIEFSVGNTWDLGLLDFIEEMNSSHENTCVTSLFGNTKLSPLANARSRCRLKHISPKDLKIFIDQAHRIGLEINWTMNSPCLGDIDAFLKLWNGDRLREKTLSFLQEYSIDRVTIAHPLLIRLLRDWKIPINVSTILNVTETSKLAWFVKHNVGRICVPIGKNRDLIWLQEFVEEGQSFISPIEPELIVNEFCHLGKYGNCEGLFRQSCYLMGTHNFGISDPWYPRALCTDIRGKDPVSWLQANWILPQHLKFYKAIGVTKFKITGRTHPTSFMKKVLPFYMDESFDGNLLDLWPHLQTIEHPDKFEETQKEVLRKYPIIPVSLLHNLFLLSWSGRIDLNSRYGRELCEKLYNQHIETKT